MRNCQMEEIFNARLKNVKIPLADRTFVLYNKVNAGIKCIWRSDEWVR